MNEALDFFQKILFPGSQKTFKAIFYIYLGRHNIANPFLFFVYFVQTIQFLQQINVINVHPVFCAGIRTHDILNMSHHT